MKKLMACVLAGAAALAFQGASAQVQVMNDTDRTFFVHTHTGKVVGLLPGQSAFFCNFDGRKFNVRVPTASGRLATACTITPAPQMFPELGGTTRVRVDAVAPVTNGGCHSYYPFLF